MLSSSGYGVSSHNCVRDDGGGDKVILVPKLRTNVSQPNGDATFTTENNLNDLEEKSIRSAVQALKESKVIGVPTDTIYGIAALAQSEGGIRRIYQIKHRDSLKPIAVCVGDVGDVYKICKVTVQNEILQKLYPGPVTLVFERLENLNKNLNPDTNLIGVRIPDFHWIRKLCRACKEPIALTSANISNEKSPVCVEDFRNLWPQLEYVFDGGVSSASNLGSTVVDLSHSKYYRIIRPGSAETETVQVLESFGLKRM